MFVTRLVLLGAAAFAAVLPSSLSGAAGGEKQHPVVRLAELRIDPEQLDRYLAALREEMETSMRVEPGVLTLYAVQVKDEPSHVRLFEMYADSNAYRSHIASPHFLKYKSGTQAMVKSLDLLETKPLLLAAKPTARLRRFVSILGGD